LFDHSQRKALSELYQSSTYAEHHEDHMVRDGGTFRLASEAQVDVLIEQWPDVRNCSNILDIGCFDGKLLAALARRTAAKRFVGFDVATCPSFPSMKGFEFHTGNREKLRGPFDLVLLSQSLIYISDITNLFYELDYLLKADGRIFVHVPNTSHRPCSLLLADQVFHFTSESLAEVFAAHGYFCDFIVNHSFNRDILMLAERRATARSIPKDLALEPVSNLFQKLESMASRILAVSGNDLAVFGTTIEAAFVHSLIAPRVSCFVDENTEKLKRSFNGLPIVLPHSLNENTTCLIPMGETAAPLAARLTANFTSHFLLI